MLQNAGIRGALKTTWQTALAVKWSLVAVGFRSACEVNLANRSPGGA